MATSNPPEAASNPQPPNELPFVNREEDIRLLLRYTQPLKQNGSFIILMAPSGFGKTRLTKRLLEVLREQRVPVAAVEHPDKAKASVQTVYQGFFIQRCAEALDSLAADRVVSLPRFDEFLKSDRLRRARAIDWRSALRKVPSLKALYEVSMELFDRTFNIGDHSASKLLTSDSREAIDTCTRYVSLLKDVAPLVMVIREAQHIDLISLQLFAKVFPPEAARSIILEYTLDTSGTFSALYDEFISAAPLRDANWLHIVKLVQLTKPHLEELLRKTLQGSQEISGEYYLRWDGNVRAINQLRFSISMEQRAELPRLEDLAIGVIDGYRRQITARSSTARMILCLLLAHGEALPNSLLPQLLNRLNLLASMFAIEHEVDALVIDELAVRHHGDALGIDNEDVAEAVRTHPNLAGLLLLAKGALRDYYREVVLDAGDTQREVSLALRQALRLSIELADVTTIEAIVEKLTGTVTVSIDQSWYVGQIATAINGNAHLFADQRDKLVLWAAELACEVADFRKARDLLRQLSVRSAFTDAMLGSCLIETGDHTEAQDIVKQLKMSVDANERFAGELIELILLRCTGHIDEARQLWNQLNERPGASELNLYGYLLRFKELVEDFPDCMDALHTSSDWFAERKLASSAAYSELTLASHLARVGDVKGAEESIETARSLLALTARDQHIILNNEAAVNLLSDDPNPAMCCAWLARAVPCAGDDYSVLVLYTNLAISAALAGRNDIAEEASERSLHILMAPKFAERNIFWGAIFNLRYVNDLLSLGHRAELDRLSNELQPHVLQDAYWQYRFGHSQSAPERFSVMLSKPYHPLFLSHWTLDVDGLRTLKTAPSGVHPNMTNHVA